MELLLIFFCVIAVSVIIAKISINRNPDFKQTSNDFRNHSERSDIQILVPKLLKLVEQRGYLVVDSYTKDQYSKNKIGWYLNSYRFTKDYNQSDRYIADVEFFDSEKRIGDIKRIALMLNSKPKPKPVENTPYFYKSSRIKSYQIRGLKYKHFTDSDFGKFYGYVKTEPDNKFDKFAISIFNDGDIHIGYIPKGDEYLFNTLELIGGQQQAWGYIHKTTSGTLYGNVFIPIKCSNSKIEKAKEEFRLNRDYLI